MWSSASHYSSTPHLFVYQPSDDNIDDVDYGETERTSSDSGYADSMRSAESASSSTAGPEPIYYSASELSQYQRNAWNSKETQEESTNRHNGKYNSKYNGKYNEDMQGRKLPEGGLHLTEMELMRVETFFRGNQTQVYVGKSLANLYLRTAKSLVGLNRCSSQPDVCSRTLQRQENRVSDWQLKFTGIPVVLLDMGATRSRDQRRIQLVLAERATGFTLWRDIIDNLSNYEAADATFHTMRLSTDHRHIAGLSFDSPEAADELFRYIETLTSNPANVRLSAPKSTSRTSNFLRFFTSSGGKKCGKLAKHPALPALPRKSDISQPCFFQHVTSVDTTDRGKLFSLQSLVPPQ